MSEKWRQKLHLEPPKGWLNDPNGLCYFKGKYHVYFQYSPESAEGAGKKCWGHYESSDMIEWKFTGIVLQPDIPEDRDGVYSGSAFEKDGLLHLFYTGNVKEEGDYDYILEGRGANVIKVTTKDGHSMSEKKVLLRNQDYPDFCSCHVRDPKIWEENGVYYMVLGARTREDEGCVLIYQSFDLEEWTYTKSYAIPDFGYMWECPDYFSLNGKQFLGISPQGLISEEYRFQNIYQAGYLYQEQFEEWDYGFDFYAPQTFDAADGRKILIGWMGLPDIDYQNPTVRFGRQHCLTIPGVLQEEAGKIKRYPVEELTQLRYGESEWKEETEMSLSLPFDLEANMANSLSMTIENGLHLQYDGKEFVLSFENEELGGGRKSRKILAKNCRKIRMIADMSSLEIYLEEGKYVLTTRFYPPKEEVFVVAKGLTGKAYNLKEMKIEI